MGDGMRCPLCGSTDVECSETTAHHVHLCNACGHKDIFRGKPTKASATGGEFER